MAINNGITSAGVPIPDFEQQSQEEIEEYAWRMKAYENDILPREYPKLPPHDPQAIKTVTIRPNIKNKT